MENNLGERISILRKQKRITQSQLADFVGVTKASVSKWENGQTYPDITLLPLLAAYFNQTIDELLGYDFQLTHKEIEGLYSELKQQISSSPSDTLNQIRQLTKRYWNCYPLVLSLSSLLLNHGTELSSVISLNDLNEECNIYLTHVYTYSKEEDIRIQAKSLLAIILLSQNKTADLLTFLGDKASIVLPMEPIISTALVIENRPEDAKEVIQVTIYQYIVVLLNLLSNYLSIPTVSKEQLFETIRLIDGILVLFDVASFHPIIALMSRFQLIIAYTKLDKLESALDELEKYSRILNCTSFPVELHGNAYFDKVDIWIDQLLIGSQTPRNTLLIEKELISNITETPLLEPLHHLNRFQQLVQHLQGGTENNEHTNPI